MAAKKENVLLQNAFALYDERVTRFLEIVPDQLQAPQLDPPGPKKTVIKPIPNQFNPVEGI